MGETGQHLLGLSLSAVERFRVVCVAVHANILHVRLKRWQSSSIESNASRASRAGLILGFEIELDLHIVWVVEENLPTGAIGHLVHAVGDALASEVLLRRFKAVQDSTRREQARGRVC